MGMRAWYDVFCDAPDCAQWTYGGATSRLAAENARDAGWTNKRGEGWRCPDHQTKAKARPRSG